jgi:V/A-type H+/Na+-transporting ATPase subunit K
MSQLNRRTLLALPLALTALAALLAAGATALALFAPSALAQTAPRSLPPEVWTWGLLSAALATGVSSLAAGFAVAKLGAAAVGALAEKPDLFGRLLIFVGLAEGIAIYGVIISILILNRLV